MFKELTKKDFEDLKEALTVILNEEFMDLIIWPDKGYKVHEKLRAALAQFWRKNRNFAKLIDYGVKVILSQKNNNRAIAIQPHLQPPGNAASD